MSRGGDLFVRKFMVYQSEDRNYNYLQVLIGGLDTSCL